MNSLRGIALGILALTGIARAAAAQDWVCDEPGDLEVRRLAFTGNTHFSDAILRAAVFTEPSSSLRRLIRVYGTRRCLDNTEFPFDAARVRFFYHNNGYRDARVEARVDTVGAHAVAITFDVREGPPTHVEALSITGLDGVARREDILARLPLQRGMPLNLYALQLTVDTLTRRLRDNGYPNAIVLRSWSTDTARHAASVAVEVDPGTRAVYGAVSVDVTPRPGTRQQVSDAVVARLLGVRPGELYRESELERAKRNLYLTEAFSTVAVELDSADVVPPGDSVVRIQVSVSEALMRSVRPSWGWGSLDCFRADGVFRHNNVLGTARRLEVRGRLSKIGAGDPIDVGSLCTNDVRNDPYSARVNYYGGFTLTAPTPSWFGLKPSYLVYSERRSEFNAYLRTAPIGALLTGVRQGSARRTQALAYQVEYGKTEAQPAILCALQSACLPEDREPLLGYRRDAVASWTVQQDWSDDPQYPTRGGVGRVELRHASKAVGSDGNVQFSRASTELSSYFRLGTAVLAAQVRVGTVVGASLSGASRFIPPHERLYAGGNTTVRGFTQNDLGPKVYIARGYDTVRVDGRTGPITPDETVYYRAKADDAPERSVPTGGSALIVASIELRMPSPILPDLLGVALFADGGELWSAGAAESRDRFRSLKVTPGVGVRIRTPIGPIRVDMAYNAYSPRDGALFFDTPISLGGQMYCVSPGNQLAVTGLGLSGQTPEQAPGICPADFRPRRPASFLRRLQLQFGIGQAF